MKVSGKVIVVTGAASGIGKALVFELLSRGARVAAVDINESALSELNSQIENSDIISTHVVDIMNANQIETLPEVVIAAHGSIDGIVNNAGIIQPFVSVEDLDFDAIERVMQINFYGTLRMVKAFLPHLKSRQEAHIVNVSSMGGFLPVPGQSVYGASKAAVKLLSEGLYAELRETPVKVSIVFPGATDTNITKNSGVNTPNISEDTAKSYPTLTPEKVAKSIVDGVERNTLRIYTGKDSKMMNRLYRLAPTFATNLIAKQMKSLLEK